MSQKSVRQLSASPLRNRSNKQLERIQKLLLRGVVGVGGSGFESLSLSSSAEAPNSTPSIGSNASPCCRRSWIACRKLLASSRTPLFLTDSAGLGATLLACRWPSDHPNAGGSGTWTLPRAKYTLLSEEDLDPPAVPFSMLREHIC